MLDVRFACLALWILNKQQIDDDAVYQSLYSVIASSDQLNELLIYRSNLSKVALRLLCQASYLKKRNGPVVDCNEKTATMKNRTQTPQPIKNVLEILGPETSHDVPPNSIILLS